MSKEKNVIQFPRKAIQGSPLPPTERHRGAYELNNEYVPASKIVRDHIALLKSTVELICNTPPHMQRKTLISTFLVNTDLALGELAICFDYDDIKIRYPLYMKDKENMRGNVK